MAGSSSSGRPTRTPLRYGFLCRRGSWTLSMQLAPPIFIFQPAAEKSKHGRPNGKAGEHSHQLRDTFSVNLLRKGRTLEDVAALLGNTVDVCEKHYSPWVQSRQSALEDAVRAT